MKDKTYPVVARFTKREIDLIRAFAKAEKRSMGNQLVVMVRSVLHGQIKA